MTEGSLQSFWYLASPYSAHPDGIDIAWHEACRSAGLLISAGIPVFCPIAHSHPIARASGLDPASHALWLPADRPMMDAAQGMILLRLSGWQRSRGIAFEQGVFLAAGKPIVPMDSGVIPADLLRQNPTGPVC